MEIYGRLAASLCLAAIDGAAQQVSSTNIFAPASTPAKTIFGLSVFVLVVTAVIFCVVFTLLVYSLVKFRGRSADAGREPAQISALAGFRGERLDRAKLDSSVTRSAAAGARGIAPSVCGTLI
jgi:hypothetical protein